MNRGDWIAIAAILIAAFLSSIQILLQWLGMRSSRPGNAIATRRVYRNTKFKWFVPTWVLRAGTFIVQTIAIYVLAAQYRSSEPLTRPGAVLIASMAAVLAICFLMPLIIGAYRQIEEPDA